MKIYIYIIAILLVLFFGRTYIKGFILTLIDKKKAKQEQKEIKDEYIYTPILSSRTFQFTIQVDEVGDGKAVLSIVKTKD